MPTPRTKSSSKSVKAPKAKATKAKATKGKAAKAKAVKPKAKTPKAKAKAVKVDGLTATETAVLQALKSGKEMTRQELREATGARMSAKLLGAATREDGGVQGGGLLGRGLIDISQYEGSRTLYMVITAKGRKALQAS